MSQACGIHTPNLPYKSLAQKSKKPLKKPNSPSNGTDQEPLGVRTVTHFIGIPGVPPAAVAEFAASAAHENLDYVEGP